METQPVDLGTPERHRHNGGLVFGARIQSDGGVVLHQGAAARFECALDAFRDAGILDGCEGGTVDRKIIARTRYEAGMRLRRLFIKAGQVGVRAANLNANGGGGDISDAVAQARSRYNAAIRHLGAFAQHTSAYCCHDHIAATPANIAALKRGLDRLCLLWDITV